MALCIWAGYFAWGVEEMRTQKHGRGHARELSREMAVEYCIFVLSF